MQEPLGRKEQEKQSIKDVICGERSSLRRFLTRRVSNPADVDDFVQESYLRLCNARRKNRIENARGFLYRIASNLVVDKYRSLEYNTRSVSIDSMAPAAPGLVSDAPTPEQSVATDQLLTVLTAVIESLPPRCRQVFLAHRVKQMTHREIADDLGISTQMVEKHISKAVRFCVERMEPHR